MGIYGDTLAPPNTYNQIYILDFRVDTKFGLFLPA